MSSRQLFPNAKSANDYLDHMLYQDREQTGDTDPKISGLDLKVGGDWARTFYDKAIPNFLRKYSKAWDAKVGETEILTGKGETERDYSGPTLSLDDVIKARDKEGSIYQGQLSSMIDDMKRGIPFRDAMLGSGSEGLADKFGGKFTHVKAPDTIEKVHSIEISPAMKKSLMQEGQPISKAQPIRPAWANAVMSQVA